MTAYVPHMIRPSARDAAIAEALAFGPPTDAAEMEVLSGTIALFESRDRGGVTKLHASLGVDIQAVGAAPGGECLGIDYRACDQETGGLHLALQALCLLQPSVEVRGQQLRICHDVEDARIVLSPVPRNSGGADLSVRHGSPSLKGDEVTTIGADIEVSRHRHDGSMEPVTSREATGWTKFEGGPGAACLGALAAPDAVCRSAIAHASAPACPSAPSHACAWRGLPARDTAPEARLSGPDDSRAAGHDRLSAVGPVAAHANSTDGRAAGQDDHKPATDLAAEFELIEALAAIDRAVALLDEHRDGLVRLHNDFRNLIAEGGGISDAKAREAQLVACALVFRKIHKVPRVARERARVFSHNCCWIEIARQRGELARRPASEVAS